MKNQFFAIISALGIWLIIVLGVNFIAVKIFDYIELTRYILYLSIFAGILSGLTFLAISKTTKIFYLLNSLIIVSVIWIISFPTPTWKNPFLWNWPIVGFLCMFLVVTVGVKMSDSAND